MKTKVLLAVLLIFFSSCHKNETDIPSQLLVNGNMESGTTQPESWVMGQDSTNISHSWTTSVSSSPTHSLEMSCIASSRTATAIWEQPYLGAIPVGKSLTFSIKVKGVDLLGTGVSIVIRTDDLTANGAYTVDQFVTSQSQISITGTFDWTTYTITLPNVSTTAKRIDVLCYYLSGTTGTVYFDDASLTHD